MDTVCVNCSSLNDRPLCFRCVGVLHDKLVVAAWLAEELEITITRQSQTGPPNQDGKASDTPLAFDDDASQAAWLLNSTIEWWANAIATDLELWGCGARWLADHVVRLARRDDIAQCFKEICEAVEIARKAVDLPEHSIFLGDCECGHRLFGDPTEHSVPCRRCGTSHDVAVMREANRVAGRNVYVTAVEASHYLGDVYGIRVTAARIRLWAHRGKLRSVEGYYRMGDIISTAEKVGAVMKHQPG